MKKYRNLSGPSKAQVRRCDNLGISLTPTQTSAESAVAEHLTRSVPVELSKAGIESGCIVREVGGETTFVFLRVTVSQAGAKLNLRETKGGKHKLLFPFRYPIQEPLILAISFVYAPPSEWVHQQAVEPAREGIPRDRFSEYRTSLQMLIAAELTGDSVMQHEFYGTFWLHAAVQPLLEKFNADLQARQK